MCRKTLSSVHQVRGLASSPLFILDHRASKLITSIDDTNAAAPGYTAVSLGEMCLQSPVHVKLHTVYMIRPPAKS